MQWRIYYANGGTFSSEDGNCREAPPWGVLVIVQQDTETGRSFWKDCDFYWWVKLCWVGGDLIGLLDYLAHCNCAKVLQGRTVPDSIYREAMRRAVNDSDFPRRSAKHSREKLDG